MDFGWLWCINLGSSLVTKVEVLLEDVDNGGGYACVWAECIWELSVPSSQFCCELKTALKK